MHGAARPARGGQAGIRTVYPWHVSILRRLVTLPHPSAPAPSSNQRANERTLIRRVLDGDRLAARDLYDAHVDRVFRLAFRLTGDEERARELTQETFIRAFAQLRRFRGESALGTWLYRITVTVSSNLRRKHSRRDRETDLDAVADLHAVPDPRADPDLRERMRAAIDRLPEIYRTTFVMHDVEGYTHLEIAQVLGVAEGTCKSRLFVARGMLREALAPFMKE